MRIALNIIKWIIASILAFFGFSMIVGFLADRIQGTSDTPLLFDLIFVTLIGLVPLGGGIMLFCMQLPWPKKQIDQEK